MFGMYDGRTLQLLELDSLVVQGLDVPVGARRRDLAAAAAGAGLTLPRLKGGTDLRSAPVRKSFLSTDRVRKVLSLSNG